MSTVFDASLLIYKYVHFMYSMLMQTQNYSLRSQFEVCF